MRYLLAVTLLVACTDGGVSSHPQSPDWDVTLEQFAHAWCDWNYTCDNRHDTGCPSELSNIMNMSTRPELAAGAEDDCIACMHAWTDVLTADASPCTGTLTFDQNQSVHAACMAANCIENHDLPGSSPQ